MRKSAKHTKSRTHAFETLRVQDAADAQAALASLAKSRSDVALDISRIESIDTIGLQLLLSFQKSMQALGRSVSFTAPSDALRSAAAAIGLDLNRFPQLNQSSR